jgi:hypothetical protein
MIDFDLVGNHPNPKAQAAAIKVGETLDVMRRSTRCLEHGASCKAYIFAKLMPDAALANFISANCSAYLQQLKNEIAARFSAFHLLGNIVYPQLIPEPPDVTEAEIQSTITARCNAVQDLFHRELDTFPCPNVHSPTMYEVFQSYDPQERTITVYLPFCCDAWREATIENKKRIDSLFQDFEKSE